MYKIFLFIFIAFAFTHCGAPGTALLGPIFTGATTKSAARASLSFTSNQMIKKIHVTAKNQNTKNKRFVKKFPNTIKNPYQIDFHN